MCVVCVCVCVCVCVLCVCVCVSVLCVLCVLCVCACMCARVCVVCACVRVCARAGACVRVAFLFHSTLKFTAQGLKTHPLIKHSIMQNNLRGEIKIRRKTEGHYFNCLLSATAD